jgi:hypothetical protein
VFPAHPAQSDAAVLVLCVCHPSPPCLAACAERPVEVEGGADQSQVGEGLGEVAQRLAAGTDLLGVEPHVVGVAQHLLEDEPSLIEAARARERFDEPERAQAERPLVPSRLSGDFSTS